MFISTCLPQGRATTARKGRESLDLNYEHQNSSNGFLLSIYIPCLSGKKKNQNSCVSLGQKPTCQWLCWGSRLTMAFKRAVEQCTFGGSELVNFSCISLHACCTALFYVVLSITARGVLSTYTSLGSTTVPQSGSSTSRTSSKMLWGKSFSVCLQSTIKGANMLAGISSELLLSDLL